jgi:hypothetical protein
MKSPTYLWYSLVGSSLGQQNTPTSSLNTGGRKSIDQWEAALALAESCCVKFEEPVASHQDIEDRANKALGLLTQR